MSSFRPALTLGKICGRLPQDLIRASQFAIVAFQFLQALALVGPSGRRAGPYRVRPGRTQFRSVSPVHPNLLAIDVIAAHCDGCSGPCSRTIRMARSRTSAEYFLGLAMGSILSRNEPSEKPGTIHFLFKDKTVARLFDLRDTGSEGQQPSLRLVDGRTQPVAWASPHLRDRHPYVCEMACLTPKGSATVGVTSTTSQKQPRS